MEQNTQQIYNDLKSKYQRSTISKRELANELNISSSTIDLYISKGYGLPPYKKLGKSKNGRVFFNLIDVANFLTQTTQVA